MKTSLLPCLSGIVACTAAVATHAANYTWNANAGAWTERSNWVETENWTPMAPESGPTSLDRITAIDGSVSLSLGGESRAVAEIYRRDARGKWYVYGDGAAPLCFSAEKISNLSLGDLVFQNGAGGKGELTIEAGVIEVSAGGLYFGAKSKTPSRAMGRLAVRDETRVSGRGALFLNVGEASESSLGLLVVNEGGVTLNISLERGEKRVGVRGIEGESGFVQAAIDASFDAQCVLVVETDKVHRTAVDLRDSPGSERGAARLSVVKRGEGTQALAGKSSYGGTTTIEKGAWVVDESHAGGDAYRVKEGGILAGVGVIEAKTIVVENGGSLSPGNEQKPAALLSLSLSGDLDLSRLNGTGGLRFDLQGEGKSDHIRLSAGGLNIGLLSFQDFQFVAKGRPRPGRYVLIDASAPIVGSLDGAEGEINGARARITIDPTHHDVILDVR